LIDDQSRANNSLVTSEGEEETGASSGTGLSSRRRSRIAEAVEGLVASVEATGVVFGQVAGSAIGLATNVTNFSFDGTNVDIAGTVTGSVHVSDVAIGTAPLTVTSTTVVTNLNVDQVDGKHETEFALLAGRAGGQTLKGGTASGDDLVLQSTDNATKGVVQLIGGHKITRTAVAFAATPYAVLEGDYYIGVDSSGGAIVIGLPVAATAGAGRVIVVKDESGNAAANPIAVTPDAGDNIDGGVDGVAVSIAANYGSLTVISNGTDWRII